MLFGETECLFDGIQFSRKLGTSSVGCCRLPLSNARSNHLVFPPFTTQRTALSPYDVIPSSNEASRHNAAIHTRWMNKFRPHNSLVGYNAELSTSTVSGLEFDVSAARAANYENLRRVMCRDHITGTFVYEFRRCISVRQDIVDCRHARC